ncbi:MAG: hypothetical protein WBA22_02860 [Candidatus Methanofastidiosia archaeon]
MNKERRFKLKIFLQGASKITKWKLVFGEPVDREFIDEWLSKNKSAVSEEVWRNIGGVPRDTVYSFFQETEIYIGPAYKLEIIAEEKQRTSAISPDRKSEELLKELERRNHLIEKKSNLVLNLVRIEVPRTYVRVRSTCKSIDEIWSILSESLLPPFYFDGINICSFCSMENLTPLKKVMVGNPKCLETSTLLSENPLELTKILNLHLDKFVRSRGLRRYERDTYFLTPIISGKGKAEDRIIRSYTGRDRRVARPIFEKIDEKSLYYVYHQAVRVSAKILWDDIYIQISPMRHFTDDGWTSIEGENKDRLDRKYRNPLYNRSKTYLSWTRFWKYYIFNQPFNDPLYSAWFKDFKFEGFVTFQVMGIPKPIDKSQMLVIDYMEGEDDE